MEQLLLINPNNLSREDGEKMEKRDAARAVLFDKENNVAILNVTKNNYHKLPGGGIEAGESIEEALRRECREEVGCHIEIRSEIGSIAEYRKHMNWFQTSFCFVAQVVGEKGATNMDSGEIALGFEIMWIPLEEAIELMSVDHPADLEGKFIVERDLCFLKAAQAKHL